MPLELQQTLDWRERGSCTIHMFYEDSQIAEDQAKIHGVTNYKIEYQRSGLWMLSFHTKEN